MFNLTTSALSSVWRNVTNAAIGIDYPNTARATDPQTLSDYLAAQIVGRAKRRYDICRQVALKPASTYAADVYAHSTDLKGCCFVAADEFELFYTQANLNAKCVRVLPKSGGGDHYFTVVRKASKKTSIIVDGTWRQFHKSGAMSRFCQVGTLDEIKNELAGTVTSIDLGKAYKAGLDVLDQWGTYTCFS